MLLPAGEKAHRKRQMGIYVTHEMSRLKAVYRSWAIPCAGRDVYYTRHRAEWLEKIKHAGVRRRAEHLYEHLDLLKLLRQQVRRELLV
jgi:hypothetical protein